METDGKILVIIISSTKQVMFIVEDQRKKWERTSKVTILDLSEFAYPENENLQTNSSDLWNDFV